MIESFCQIHFRAARAKNQQICRPASPPRFTQQFLRVLRSDGSFEAVKDEKAAFIRITREAMNVQKITIQCSPALDGRRLFRFTAGSVFPKRLPGGSRKAPGSMISCHFETEAQF